MPDLAVLLNINIEELLAGGLPAGDSVGGNMKKASYLVCPTCGSITLTTGGACVSCCGRKLSPLSPETPDDAHLLRLEEVEDEWFVTSAHPMEKDHFISFLALVSGEQIRLIKCYPQWELQARIPRRQHGTLLYYCTRHGLFQQRV